MQRLKPLIKLKYVLRLLYLGFFVPQKIEA